MGCGETNVFRNIEMLTIQCQGKNPKKINKRHEDIVSINVLTTLLNKFFRKSLKEINVI